MSPRSEHSPDLPPDDGRDCAWVKEHLGAYDLWDDSLSQAEFGAIERHLHYCPACASEYADIRRAREVIQMTMAGLDRDAWAREKTAFAAEILTRLRGSGLFDQEVAAPPEPLPLAVAASLLLTFALPVLAFVGVHHLWSPPAGPESHSKSQERTATTATPAQPAVTKGNYSQPSAAADLNVGVPDAASDIGEQMDSVAYAAIRDFELAALLPDTEEEYEAWARKEYAHIMALYDVLTEVNSADPDAKPLWDGRPVNIPPWGERLYADTPDQGRHHGWRALLIYSGEIFKFDWPGDLEEANCEPTLEAIQRAASVAGFTLAQRTTDGDDVLQRLGALNRTDGTQLFQIARVAIEALDWEVRLRATPETYASSLVADAPLATSTLRYFALSSELVHAPVFDEFAQETLETFCEQRIDPAIPECDVRVRLQRFDELLDSREELLNDHLTARANDGRSPD